MHKCSIMLLLEGYQLVILHFFFQIEKKMLNTGSNSWSSIPSSYPLTKELEPVPNNLTDKGYELRRGDNEFDPRYMENNSYLIILTNAHSSEYAANNSVF